MNQQPKAIFLDMDGTVLDHHNRVSENTTKVISAIRQKGIYVFIATGRTKKEVEEIVPTGFEVDGLITANGTVVHVGDQKIDEKTLPISLIQTIIDKARENKVYYEVHPVEGSMIVLNEDKSFTIDEIRDPKPDSVGNNEWISRKEAINKDIKWKAELGLGKFSKMYCFSRDQQHMEHWIHVLKELKQQIDFTMSTSSKHNVEVMVANANKATGIQTVLERFSLKAEDTLAIGDSHNDLPMFKLIGQTVAMQNAPDDIKAVVDEVTQYPCDNDGVYHYLSDNIVNIVKGNKL